MGEDDDLTRRVDALEDQTRAARADAAAARALASGADRDVTEVRAEVRAKTSAFNALRETQLEQGLKIDKIDALVRTQAEHSRILGEHSRELRDHRAMLVTVQAGVDHIVDLLTEQEPPRG